MRVGVLGGGQLARMLALAGHPLGLSLVVVDPSPEACAAPVSDHLCAGYDDVDALARLAVEAEVVTFEFENVALSTLEGLSARVPVRPAPIALVTARDRVVEKEMFAKLGIPAAPFAPVANTADLARAIEKCGVPAILKTRTEGYDGKGQVVIRDAALAESAWHALGRRPAIVEQMIPFAREVSVIAVRGLRGEIRFYPLVENTHRDGILRLSVCRTDDAMTQQAQSFAERLMVELGYVGVLALELFEVDGTLLANEFAPRVHNSGHWTIEGAATSQFENHLRAVAGLPLGATHAIAESAMVNLVGAIPRAEDVLAHDDCHLHLYGKSAREGRKLGHITVRAQNAAELRVKIDALRELPGASREI